MTRARSARHESEQPTLAATDSRGVPSGVPTGKPDSLAVELSLRIDGVLDENDQFRILHCTGASGERLVLKYCLDENADALRRLRNEALLTEALPGTERMGFLKHRAHGPGYLVTEFDPSPLLARAWPGDEALIGLVAGALADFHLLDLDTERLGVGDREPLSFFYLKETIKHLLHLCPEHLSPSRSLACLWAVLRSLPALNRNNAPSHGDVLVTNLLHDADRGRIVFTDLECMTTRNHVLFDLLALFTHREPDPDQWQWQPLFLARYLEAAGDVLGLSATSPTFRSAYRGSLVYYLVYRLNEERLDATGCEYFDGGSRWRFLVRWLGRMLKGAAGKQRGQSGDEVGQRMRALETLLSSRGFEAHAARMLGSA